MSQSLLIVAAGVSIVRAGVCRALCAKLSWRQHSQETARDGRVMSLSFAPGDDLIFQIESGFGLLRVLDVERRGDESVWHILVYEEFYPDIESAEAALNDGRELEVRRAHLALTDHAFEKTPAARLGNRPVNEDEMSAYREWQQRGGEVFDRSVLLMLGLR